MRLRIPRVTAAHLVWLMSYAALIVLMVNVLGAYRTSALSAYATSQAAHDWQQWRSAAAELSATGPVQRAEPKSVEPPALVLMRDHYHACLAIALLLSSVLYATFAVSIRGALRTRVTPNEET
jgi:hypothetical protein